MDPDRWNKLKEIVADALESESDPAARINQVASNDPQLRDEALSLLKFAAGSALDSPAWDARAFLDQHAPPSMLAAGDLLAGRFRVIGLLGQGGMGEVYAAWDEELSCQIAIKTVRPELLSGASIERFRLELLKARAIQHPNVCAVYEWHAADQGDDKDSQDGLRFFTMEYVPGETLAALILRRAPLAPQVLASIVRQAAEGLAAAHRLGIIHRDLKPANLMLAGGRAVVMDFGLALLAGSGAASRSGTPLYMAPEQKAGAALSPATDIYAFGLIVQELIAACGSAAGQRIPGCTARWRGLISRCLHKDPRRRFASAADLLSWLDAHSFPRLRSRLVYAGLGLLLFVLLSVLLMNRRPDASGDPPILTRITSHGALTDSGTISRDGRWIAYSSDFQEGNKDIYLEAQGRGSPVRLTTDPAEDWQPDIGPGGKNVVFRSERDHGGLYQVASTGGPDRLLVPGGRNPKISPDGSTVLYWASESGAGSTDDGAMYTIPLAGGVPTRICPEFADSQMPVWSADGRRILFYGLRDHAASSQLQGDWWTVSASAGEPTRTLAASHLGGARLRLGAPFAFWRDRLILSADQSDATNIWQIALDSTGRASSPARRITYGAADEMDPSISDNGTLLFTSMLANTRLWRLNTSTPERMQAIGSGASKETYPSSDAAHSLLAFRRNTGGIRRTWVRSLRDGREWPVSAADEDTQRPVLSKDGSMLAWAVRGTRDFSIRISPANSPQARLFCTDCGQPFDFSPDGTALLTGSGRDGKLQWRPLDGSSPRVFLSTADTILGAHFSPAGDALVLSTHHPDGFNAIALALLHRGLPAARTDWLTIARESSWTASPSWSSNGSEIYYISARDGFPCLWSQPLESRGYRPTGPPRIVKHFHQTAFNLNAIAPMSFHLAALSDEVVLPVTTARAEVWSASLR